MAIRLTRKEMAMRGLTPTGEKLDPEKTEQGWLIPGGIDPKTGAMPSVPSLPTVPGVSISTVGAQPKPIYPTEMTERARIEYYPTGEKIQYPDETEQIKPSSSTPLLLSDSERQELAVKAGQTTCLADQRKYEPRIYKATLKGGGYVLVEAAGKKSANERATGAGYNVQRITWSPSYGEAQPSTTDAVQQAGETSSGRIPSDEVDRIRENVSDNAFLSQALDGAVGKNDADIYNNAVEEYNRIVKDANWYRLYQTYNADKDKDWGKERWQWFQDTFSKKLDDSKYMGYIQGDEFQDDYARVIQPSSMPNDQYTLIKDFISPDGFDSQAAFQAGQDSPSKAAQIIAATNRFTAATLSDETLGKLNSGEWTLLPYGQVIDSKNLEQMPPTYRQIVETSGLVGFENYQQQVHEWNDEQSKLGNIIDAIGANAVRMGQDVKNFALLQLSMGRPEVKEGDRVPEVSGTRFIWQEGPGTFTAEGAAAYNQQQAERQQYYKDIYDEAAMAAEEWHASRPFLQPVYPAGFVDSVKENPSALYDPLLWGETIANTLPYTVATGLVVGGAAFAGPIGVAASAPLAFGLTLSVEGHDIYKDAIANGASHDQALKLANQYGSISAAIETVGDSIFVGALGFTSGAFSRSLGQNMAGNIIRGAAKKYGWKALTADVIKDFVNQGGQEFFQEVVHNAAIKTVNENQALLENTANAFVSGVIGTAPFVLVPAGGQAIRGLRGEWATEVRPTKGKDKGITPIEITPQMQFKILNKVFQPVSGFTVSSKPIVMEQLKGTPAQIKYWQEQYKAGKGRTIYEAGKNITVGLIDKKTVVTGSTKVDEVALAYAEMCNKVNEYAAVQLKLKQAEQAIADFGMAKSKKQLETLKQYKKRANELEQQLKELKGPMVEAVKKFGETFLKNSHGLEAQQKAEVRDMSRTIVADIDSVTTQLFGERNAKEIAKDIKELEGQIAVIEEEMKKGMTREQLEGYARLINMLRGQVGDLVNEMRIRYLAEGEKIKPSTKRLTMEVMSLQARLIKAVENLNNFTGSALDYDVYRKGELAHGAEVVKLERDTLEAIQKTTEAVWGKEHYADKLGELNAALRNLVATMKEAGRPHDSVVKTGFNIFNAIRERRKLQALRKQIQSLKAEAGKIKDPGLRQQANTQVQQVETITESVVAEKHGRELKTIVVKGVETYRLEYTDAEFAAAQSGKIHREAEMIVRDRLRKILERTPAIEHYGSSKDVMDYLYQIYDAEYFKTVHDGIFKDLDDYLSVENEEARIRMQVEHQEWLAQMDQQIASAEAEADLAKDLRDDETGSKRRDSLDRAGDKAKKTADDMKQALKEKQKTQVAVAEDEATLAQEERERLEKIRDKLIQERLQKIKDRLKPEEQQKLEELRKRFKEEEEARKEKKASVPVMITKKTEATLRDLGFTQSEINKMTPQEARDIINRTQAKSKEKARRLVETAKKEIAKEEEKVEEEAKEEEETKKKAKEETKRKPQPATSTQTAQRVAAKPKEQAATKTALETATKAATQTATKTKAQEQTQTEAATQTAAETATKLKVETATKEETEQHVLTKLVTETKTKTAPKTLMPFKRFRLVTDKVERKKLLKDPALATHKQGLFYISWYPQLRESGPLRVVYSRKRPPGARTATGRRSPQRTLKAFGKLPSVMELPMGVVTARVKHGRTLTFSRRNGRRRGRVLQG